MSLPGAEVARPPAFGNGFGHGGGGASEHCAPSDSHLRAARRARGDGRQPPIGEGHGTILVARFPLGRRLLIGSFVGRLASSLWHRGAVLVWGTVLESRRSRSAVAVPCMSPGRETWSCSASESSSRAQRRPRRPIHLQSEQHDFPNQGHVARFLACPSRPVAI